MAYLTGTAARGASASRSVPVDEAEAWSLLRALAQAASTGTPVISDLAVSLEQGRLLTGDERTARLMIVPGSERGFRALSPLNPAAEQLLEIFMPLCVGARSTQLVIGHLGQSLDGRVATATGESQFITGAEDVCHTHRLRALFDAVVVGARTVATDDPRLTTRLVDGPTPVRVVLDPQARLDPGLRVFREDPAATVLVVGHGHRIAGLGPHSTVLQARVDEDGFDLNEVLNALRAQGLSRIFVEGGGVDHLALRPGAPAGPPASHGCSDADRLGRTGAEPAADRAAERRHAAAISSFRAGTRPALRLRFASRVRLHWIAPALDGPPTGGTLYNARMLAALRAAGVECTQGVLDNEIPPAPADIYLLDSLYLAHAAALREAGARPLWLLLHYLPSLIRPEAPVGPERDALACADGLIVTSAFMQRHVRELAGGLSDKLADVVCVEPGVDAEPAARPALSSPPWVIMLAHVTDNKGIAPLLAALARRLREDDRFALRIVGSLDAEPAYAAACAAQVTRHPALKACVAFTGLLAPPDARAELCRADLLVSASRFESYGMALAEARAAGVPILATPGGHAAGHVNAIAGGELSADVELLAPRLLTLVRTPALLAERKRAALAHRYHRPWQAAAREFAEAVSVQRAPSKEAQAMWDS